jgi:penicillin-binding protein 2
VNFLAARGAALVLRLSDRKLLHVEVADLAARWLVAPASTLKPFSLLALLEAGKLNPSDAFACSRRLSLASHQLNCVHPPVSLPMNPARAIAYSCNGAVAHFAERFAADELPQALVRYGLTSVTGLLPGEATGRVKRNTVGTVCQLQALGEEGILVTPVGMLLAYARLAKRLDRKYITILEGLEGAVEFGTAQAAQMGGVKVAGKTGSIAGTAWFSGFAPSRSPKLAVTVLVQGRSGGFDAAPIAAALFRKYLS